MKATHTTQRKTHKEKNNDKTWYKTNNYKHKTKVYKFLLDRKN